MTKPDFVKLAEEVFEARAYQQEFPIIRESRGRAGEEYEIPAGLNCKVCHSQDLERRWSDHVTRKKTYARRVGGKGGAIVLKNRDWLLLAPEGDVRVTCRTDIQPEGGGG